MQKLPAYIYLNKEDFMRTFFINLLLASTTFSCGNISQLKSKELIILDYHLYNNNLPAKIYKLDRTNIDLG